MDAGVIAAIIGGIAAVLGLVMAAIAIVVGRSMKAAAEKTGGEADVQQAQTPVASIAGDDRAMPSPSEPPSPDDPTAFTDPFAENDEPDADDSLEWGSAFDTPTDEPETKFGFDDADPPAEGIDDPGPQVRP